LEKNEGKLRTVGVALTARELLMAMREGNWEIDECLKKAATSHRRWCPSG
jgi:hypothetical protein